VGVVGYIPQLFKKNVYKISSFKVHLTTLLIERLYFIKSAFLYKPWVKHDLCFLPQFRERHENLPNSGKVIDRKAILENGGHPSKKVDRRRM